jgi:transcriptional regulator with GAF, ATPase, and Fis domain
MNLRVIPREPDATTIQERHLLEAVPAIARHSYCDQIVGDGRAMAQVLAAVDQVAATNAPVLLTGETGTGKELVARAIHRRSARQQRPLVVVNCAALPSELLESELFGHERGAFTGAHAAQLGRFEYANRGTLLLDEVGELPLNAQAKLLRVLQSGHLERLGNPRPVHVDVRVIAATNRDLVEEVRRKAFRTDLFYRLNVIPIAVPPLRERKEDIAALVHHLIRRFSHALQKPIDSIALSVIEELERYDWPGNVRELENVLQRAIIQSAGTTLTLDDGWKPAEPPSAIPAMRLVDIERQHIMSVLDRTHWRIEGYAGAAALLGLKASTLRSRLLKLGIERPHSS